MLGTVGELLLLVAFVACPLAGVAFFQAARDETAADWRRVGTVAWWTMTLCVIVPTVLLSVAFFTHQYQYAYVYQNSDNAAPLHFLLSALWAGQEGSFLLWIAYTALTGGAVLLWAPKDYRMPVMSVIAFCQLFLVSMVVGLHLGPLQIGSSPFATLAERFPEAPIFQQNPDFVPADGTGLNDLLKNPWMVIHPPTLFIGFALMIVPFAFAIAALWKKQYTQWVKPALPWTILATLILGLGICMGGYWAYVTLSFGGYWAWDPVENSSLVPWVVAVAAIHTMIIQKKSGGAHKASLFLSILAFMLVIYSTFLTRSGILGTTSVHSFVDLGLMNQLLVWILAMGVVGFGLFAWRYADLPKPDKEPSPLSREFMVLSGALLLTIWAAVVLLGTSTPIIGRIFRDRPSAVDVAFYNEWTMPLAIGFTFLAGIGQLFWWHKMSVQRVNQVLLKPVALATVSTVAVLLLTPFVAYTVDTGAAQAAPEMVEAGLGGGLGGFWEQYGMSLQLLLLVFMGFFALFGNGMAAWRVARGNLKMLGGAVTHVGFALMVLGIIASAAFSNPLPFVNGEPAPGQNEQGTFVLTKDDPRRVGTYRVEYAGQRVGDDGHPTYTLNFASLDGEHEFTLEPVVYKSNTDQWIQHPDVAKFVGGDLYAAVTPRAMLEEHSEEAEAAGTQLTMSQGETANLDGFTLTFTGFDPNPPEERLPEGADLAVAARVEVTNTSTGEMRELAPIYVVMEDRTVQFVQNRIAAWDFAVAFAQMSVDTGQAVLSIEGADVAPEDWIVVQAYEKPFISILWLGIWILSLGFMLAFVRRLADIRFSAKRSVAG